MQDLVRSAGGRLDTRWHDDGLRVRIELPLETVLEPGAPGAAGA